METVPPFPELPRRLPKVVQDAIKVTTQFHERYLWVDRYCIPPRDADEKENHEQFSNMDVIYAGAELTIVAGAGGDSAYGLPGVSTRKRHTQPSVTVAGITYVSTMGNPADLIRNSIWWTRGWCYQEALLSRRRLIFIDEQVYFGCYSMFCYEVLHHPLNNIHNIHIDGRRAMQPALYRRALFNNGGAVTRAQLNVFGVIHTYSNKQLSFDADALKAIKGVFAMMTRSPAYVFNHYVGIPLVGSTSQDAFLKGLLWYPSSRQTRRRRDSGLPSWSWTGFVGQVQYGKNDIGPVVFTNKQDIVDPFIQVRVGVRVDKTIEWEAFVREGHLKHPPRPKGGSYLHLFVTTMYVSVKYTEEQGEGQYWVCMDRVSKSKNTCFRCLKVVLNWETLDSGQLLEPAH
jgi:hypothetical protein